MREEGILKLHFTEPFFIFPLETSFSKLKGTPNSVWPKKRPRLGGTPDVLQRYPRQVCILTERQRILDTI